MEAAWAATNRRSVGSLLLLVAGVVAICLGIYIAMGYVDATDAALIDVASAKGTATALRVEHRSGGRYSTPRHHQFVSFEFTDPQGVVWRGEREVSDQYALQHPVGSIVGVYFYPDDPARAVLGSPTGLALRGADYHLWIGAMGAIVLGLLGVYFGAGRWLRGPRASRGARRASR